MCKVLEPRGGVEKKCANIYICYFSIEVIPRVVPDFSGRGGGVILICIA